MPDADLLIWWTDGDDCRAIVDAQRSALSDYIRDELRSRHGRNGRGRLWIPDGIPLRSIPWPGGKPLAKLIEKHSYAGVVFRSWDLVEVIDLPGFVTDLNLDPVDA